MHAGSAALVFLSSLGALCAQDPATLKIQRIVLYKHGVGFFERQGAVNGNATVALSFTSAQMKDVLKSLFVVDLDGGRIATVHYDSKDPIQKQLEDILFRIPDASAMTQFLAQLKGAQVSVTIGSRQVEGRVLGIEPITVQTEQGMMTRHRLVLMTSLGTIEAVELQDASHVSILDEMVRRDLARMMDIYAKARYADRKTVTVQATGDGERRVRAGYIIETPIWKTSYRLLLEPGQAPRLQGWAIVENRTEEDWNEVGLTFVAGSPMSFVLDLYTSYYPQRPVVAMDVIAAESPLEAGRMSPARGAQPPGAPAPSFRRRAEKAEDFAAAEPAAEAELGKLIETSMAPVAEGVEIGDLFSYQAKGPVTIRQGQAALVPILFEELGSSEKVLHWRGSFSPHPAHAMFLRNATKLTLEKGPVTVFEGAACLGEGMLTRTLKPGMHEMVRYALESAVEVEPRSEQRATPVVRGVVANGVLTLTSTQVHEVTYKLRNKSGKEYTLYLDQPKLGGTFELVEPKQPFEQLPEYWRFQVALPADAEKALVVREEQPVRQQLSIVDQDPESIRFHLQQRYLDEQARTLLAKVVELMDQRAAADRRLAQLTQDRKQELDDQQNLRNNINVLRDVTSPEQRTLRDQYVQRLTESMQRIDRIDGEIRELRATRERLHAQITQVLRG